MSKGWDLREGQAVYHVVSEEVIWTQIMKVLSPQSKKTTSYKFALLRAIVENLYKVNDRLELSYTQIAYSFSKLYWNLVVRNGYSQGHRAQIEKDLLNIQAKHQLPIGLSFDSLSEDVQIHIVNQVEKNVLSKYVVGALYADTGGILYGFSKKERTLALTLHSYEFLLKFQTTIFKLINYELVKFLQMKNPTITEGVFIEVIEDITKRESLTGFQKLLVEHDGNSCFYTDHILGQQKRAVAVDHFVPWSFLHSDELWNFVLTSQSLNSSKGSKLPDERYLSKLDARNKRFCAIGDVYVKQYMENYQFQTLVQLYQYAELNGFEKGWMP